MYLLHCNKIFEMQVDLKLSSRWGSGQGAGRGSGHWIQVEDLTWDDFDSSSEQEPPH